jgi:hypothetical protein
MKLEQTVYFVVGLHKEEWVEVYVAVKAHAGPAWVLSDRLGDKEGGRVCTQRANPPSLSHAPQRQGARGKGGKGRAPHFATCAKRGRSLSARVANRG